MKSTWIKVKNLLACLFNLGLIFLLVPSVFFGLLRVSHGARQPHVSIVAQNHGDASRQV
jgi:hypothetical protein